MRLLVLTRKKQSALRNAATQDSLQPMVLALPKHGNLTPKASLISPKKAFPRKVVFKKRTLTQ